MIDGQGLVAFSTNSQEEKVYLIIHLKMCLFELWFKFVFFFFLPYSLQGRRMGMLSSSGIAVRSIGCLEYLLSFSCCRSSVTCARGVVPAALVTG